MSSSVLFSSTAISLIFVSETNEFITKKTYNESSYQTLAVTTTAVQRRHEINVTQDIYILMSLRIPLQKWGNLITFSIFLIISIENRNRTFL